MTETSTDEDFKVALKAIHKWETDKYTNHPWDPGKATKHGITGRTLSRWRGHKVSNEDVKNLTYEEASQIYYHYYWLEAKCNLMPRGLSCAVFNSAVNQGTGRASRLLQKALRVRTDGVIGPITLSKLQKANTQNLLLDFMAYQLLRYTTLGKLFTVAGRGWFRRTLDIYFISRHLLTK